MAMVTITNDEVVTKVPFAAYQSQFKGLGFRIVANDINGETVPSDRGNVEDEQHGTEVTEETSTANEADEVEDVEDDEEDEQADDEAAFVEDILEKPLSQWTVDELKEFVRIKDIDTSGAKKTSEVRSIVKKFLEEQEKASVNS